MRRYYVVVTWNKGGVGYPCKEEISVQASSVRAAATAGLRISKQRDVARAGRRWREPLGSTFQVSVIVGGKIENKGGA